MEFIRAAMEQMAKREIERQEQKIIKDYTTAGQITPQGMNRAIKEMQAAVLSPQRQQALIIANAATAAAIRKAIPQDVAEIIISNAAETGTAYIVTDDLLKEQLFESIEKRGY